MFKAPRRPSDTQRAQWELGVGWCLPKLNQRDIGPRWTAYVMAPGIYGDDDGDTMKTFRQVITPRCDTGPTPPPKSLIPFY